MPFKSTTKHFLRKHIGFFFVRPMTSFTDTERARCRCDIIILFHNSYVMQEIWLLNIPVNNGINNVNLMQLKPALDICLARRREPTYKGQADTLIRVNYACRVFQNPRSFWTDNGHCW